MEITKVINFIAISIIPSIFVGISKLSYMDITESMQYKILLEIFFGLLVGFYICYIFQFSNCLCKKGLISFSYLLGILLPIIIHAISFLPIQFLSNYSLYNAMPAFFIVATVQIVCFIYQIYDKKKGISS